MFTRINQWRTAAVFAAVVMLCACGGGGGGGVIEPTPAPTPDLTLVRPTNYTLKWSDEFTTAGAPGSAWTYDLAAPLINGTVWGNNEKQFYTSNAENVFVSNGELTIQPVEGVPQGASSSLLATSARIKTDTATFYSALNGTPYGFYEIRAKVPCEAGAWPAIWMMGKNGDWPARGEIDIMEWFGGQSSFIINPNQVQSAVHTPKNYGSNPVSSKANVSAMCTQYHDFQLHWSASEILIGVDGVPTFSYKKPQGAGVADWPFDQPAHIILNVAVGGNLGGFVNLAKLPSMTMKVDYVKVWQAP